MKETDLSIKLKKMPQKMLAPHKHISKEVEKKRKSRKMRKHEEIGEQKMQPLHTEVKEPTGQLNEITYSSLTSPKNIGKGLRTLVDQTTPHGVELSQLNPQTLESQPDCTQLNTIAANLSLANLPLHLKKNVNTNERYVQNRTDISMQSAMSLINKLGDYNSKVDGHRSKLEKTMEPSFIPATDVAKLDLKKQMIKTIDKKAKSQIETNKRKPKKKGVKQLKEPGTTKTQIILNNFRQVSYKKSSEDKEDELITFRNSSLAKNYNKTLCTDPRKKWNQHPMNSGLEKRRDESIKRNKSQNITRINSKGHSRDHSPLS